MEVEVEGAAGDEDELNQSIYHRKIISNAQF